jgi:hypothetical protein
MKEAPLEEFEKGLVALLEKYNRFGAVLVLFDTVDNAQKVAANMCVICANEFLSQLIDDEGLTHDTQHGSHNREVKIH